MSAPSIENPFTSAFRTSSSLLALLVVASLSVFTSPLLIITVLLGIAALWFILSRPISALGIVLIFMPFDFIVIALGKFFGLPHMTLISACDKEVILLLLAYLLWRQNGFKAATPDWFLLAFVVLATIRTAFDGTLVGFVTDCAFLIPYVVGRMTVLTAQQEQQWARCAVWIVGVLSVLGLTEVFLFGEGPRTLLYLAIDSEAEGGQLSASFHGTAFLGLREAATMVGPNSFGVLCMVALIIWWVYCRNSLPATMIAVGLICSVTRAAWLGTAAAIPVLAIIMNQRKRLLLYALVAIAIFAASIPILGLGDFLFATKTAEDTSIDWHRESIVNGVIYAFDHPLGSGNTKLSAEGLKKDANQTIFETTYPYFAAEYGLVASLSFVGFLVSALYFVRRQRCELTNVAVGILVGMSLVMVITLPLTDRRLSTWILLPIGMAVQCASRKGTPFVSQLSEATGTA